MLLRRILPVILCLGLVAVLAPLGTVPVDAAGTEIKSTLDFSALPQQDNTAASVQLIKDAGAVDAVNLYVAGNHSPVANPGGYMGEGYYIQKLDAGAGNTLHNVFLDLIYWVATAEPQGYLKVYASTDNASYREVFSQTEGNGDPWVGTTIQQTSIPIELAEGAQTVYIKVVMQHWTTWEGAAVKTSTLRGTVDQGTADVPIPTVPEGTPTKSIAATFDFSAMATDVVKEEVRQDLRDYGLFDCGNIQIGGNYGNVATPGGYAGEGYVIHKLSAPEGTLLLDAQLDLRYWAYHASSGCNPGYLVISVSTDGNAFAQITRIEGAADKSTAQACLVELPMAAGAAEIYVKITMQHWESYEGAAVKKMTITGRIPWEEQQIPSDPPVETAPAEPTDPEGEPSVPTVSTAPSAPTEQPETPKTDRPGWSLPAALGVAACLAGGLVALICLARKRQRNR